MAHELPIDDVRVHQSLQFRVDGINTPNLNRIRWTLQSGGEARDPIRVAKVGKALYVVDGFHRLEAYRLERRPMVPALVAKMSLEEARESAQALNAANGKPYSRADAAALWEAYVAEGRHLDERTGKPRPTRTIRDELGGIYSHETIRKKLKGRGHDLDEDVEFGGAYKPRRPTEEELEADRLEDAEEAIGALGGLLPTLPPRDRERLIRQARGVLDAVERGDHEAREAALEELRGSPLDI